MPGWRTRAPRARRRSRRSRRYQPNRPTMTFTYLTPPDPAFKRMVEATPSGMPHWSGTGPPGTVCGQCSFYGYWMQYPNSCYRYFLMMKHHGNPLPISTPSCQHFAPLKIGL
jgi:hypothetical protein